jgi:hypothetical protein
MTPAGTVTILHAFAGGADGGAPDAPVIQATDGTLYGSTASRVSFEPHDGTIFRMTPDGTVATLHTFRDRRRAGPRTSLISVPARLCVLFVLAQGRF